MSFITKSLAEQITARGQLLHNANNSIFNLLEADNSSENISSLCSALACKVNNELILIKNKLRPLMNEIQAHMDNKLSEISSPSPITEYTVKIFEPNNMLDELVATKVVLVKRDPKFLTKILSVPVPVDDDTLLSFLKHHNAAISVYIDGIKERIGTNGIIDIWERYFTNISESNPNIASMGINTIAKLDELCIVYAITNNLVDERPAGVGGSEESYKEAMSEFYAEVCNFLAITNEHINIVREGRQLIIAINGKEAFVDGILYKEYIEGGGSPDAILGLLVSENRDLAHLLLPNIKENEQTYIEAWANFVKVTSYAQLDAEVNRHKVLYSIILRDVYNQLIPEDLKELICMDYEEAEVVFKDIVHNYSKDELLDTSLVALDIVGRVVFCKTNFYKFAKHLMEYVKLNPNFTPADGATFAAIEFIVEFMLDQLYIGGLDGTAATN